MPADERQSLEPIVGVLAASDLTRSGDMREQDSSPCCPPSGVQTNATFLREIAFTGDSQEIFFLFFFFVITPTALLLFGPEHN